MFQNRTLCSRQQLSGRTSMTKIDDQMKITVQQSGQNILPVNYSYDPQGRMTQISQGTRNTLMSYDQNGFLSQITDPENRTTYFINDAIGRILKTITPDSAEQQIQYDKNSNITGIIPPDRLIHTFIHNSVDLMASYLSPGTANPRQYQYDSDQRLRTIASEENKATTYNYGNIINDASKNKITNVTTNTFGIDYSYNQNQKWLESATSTDGVKIDYVQKGDDLLLSKEYSGVNAAPVKISYTYDLYGLAQKSEIVRVNNQDFERFKIFNADKQLIKNYELNIYRETTTGLPFQKNFLGFTENITYNSYGEISARYFQFNSVPIYTEIYTRDQLGRITNKQVINKILSNSIANLTTTSPSVTKNFGYTYDLKGRLKSGLEDGQLISAFNYDSQGNRTLVTDINNITKYTATYNSKDRLISYTASTDQTNMSYSEDDTFVEKNNITTNKTEKYFYSTLNQLQSVEQITPTETKTIKYLIDPENKRTGKLINNTPDKYFAYDKSGRLILDVDNTKSARGRDFYGTQNHSPDAMQLNTGEDSYLIKDQRGSILYVITTTGIVRQKMQYNAVGKVEVDTNPGYQPFGFAGGIYDADTGLVRFGARDYDATVGRWLTRDPILFEGGDTNLYAYVGGDPVNFVDPSGLSIADIIENWREIKKKYKELKKEINDIRKNALCKLDPTKCKDDQDPNDPFPDDLKDEKEPNSCSKVGL